MLESSLEIHSSTTVATKGAAFKRDLVVLSCRRRGTPRRLEVGTDVWSYQQSDREHKVTEL